MSKFKDLTHFLLLFYSARHNDKRKILEIISNNTCCNIIVDFGEKIVFLDGVIIKERLPIAGKPHFVLRTNNILTLKPIILLFN